MKYTGHIVFHGGRARHAGTLYPGYGPTAWGSRLNRAEIMEVEAPNDRAARDLIVAEFSRRHPEERRELAGLSYVPGCRVRGEGDHS